MLGCLAAMPTVSRATPAAVVGKPGATQAVSFTVALPLRNRDALTQLLAEQLDPASANYHKWLTPQAFGLRFGPSTLRCRGWVPPCRRVASR